MRNGQSVNNWMTKNWEKEFKKWKEKEKEKEKKQQLFSFSQP